MKRFDWSLTIGRWHGVSIRLHPAMIFVAVAAALWSCSTAVLSIVGSMTSITLVTLALLLVSVLAHEWGHWIVARRFGVVLPRIVLSPVGDISHRLEFPAAWQTIVWALVGPLVNVLICAVCLAVLALFAPAQNWLMLLHPLHPVWDVRGGITFVQTAEIAIWLNVLLALLNVLPAFPFDGAYALHGVLRWLLPNLSRSRIADIMFAVGVVSSVGMFTAATVLGRAQSDALFPTWWGLVAIAIVMLVGATRELRSLDLDDMSETNADTDTALPVPAAHGSKSLVRSSDYYWLPSGNASAGWEIVNQHLVDIEQQDDQMLDELLRRVHDKGLDSLTPAEREVLNRISTRYRRRLHRE